MIFWGGSADWAEPIISARPPWWKGRVQDEVLILILNYILLKKDLDQARLLRRPPHGTVPGPSSVSQNFDSRLGFVGKRGSKIDLVSTWLPRRLQDAFKSLQDASKKPSRASKTPLRPPKTSQDASKTPPGRLQDASKTPGSPLIPPKTSPRRPR